MKIAFILFALTIDISSDIKLVLLPLLLLTGFWAYDSEKFTAATCGDLT
jgi:hypothetical protein